MTDTTMLISDPANSHSCLDPLHPPHRPRGLRRKFRRDFYLINISVSVFSHFFGKISHSHNRSFLPRMAAYVANLASPELPESIRGLSGRPRSRSMARRQTSTRPTVPDFRDLGSLISLANQADGHTLRSSMAESTAIDIFHCFNIDNSMPCSRTTILPFESRLFSSD